MQKTPDDIKKGLECCTAGFYENTCVACPYSSLVMTECPTKLKADALSLIQQYEAQNANLLEKVEQLQAERDALMHWAKGRCDTCAHNDDCVKHDPDPEGYVMRWYDDCEIWEWRGVQEEE